MKKIKFKPLYRQIIFTILAFALMVVFGYMFDSRTVKVNLSRNAESILSFTHQQIESELISAKMMLGIFSQTVQQIILNDNMINIQRYINVISDYVISGESGLKNINGVYGYFKNIFDDDVFLYSDNINWVMPENFFPEEYAWYQNAVKNCGTIVETQPYYDYMSNEYIITFSLCIHYEEDRVSVVCIDVPLDKIGEIVVNAALSEEGYGALAAADFTIFAHANKDYVGMRLDNPQTPISQFKYDFYQGRELYERPMKNWKSEDVIVFSRILPNGWHLILLSPKSHYYTGTTQMLAVLCVLGAILAAALIMVFINIDKAREKADEESRYKSVFLANMSHEIRTPMNAIIGMTYIGKTSGDIPRKDYCFDKIENASRHLLGVINDILDMSKIEANMFELSREEFNFEKMLQRVICIVSFRAEEKKQKISVYVDKSIPRVLSGDEQRLAQVITNLLGNAVKFTHEEGSIKLDTRFISEEDGECTIRITVKDNGIGISQEHKEVIFRAFKQADTRITRKFGGTGLGLAISKNIVELMGGKIELESEPGIGSSFSFIFKAGRGSEKSAGIIDAASNWRNIKIMVVDDDKEILDYFNDIMRGFGLKCDTAQSGEDALSQINKNGMHRIYFIDWKMPDMDGIELAKKLKTKSKFPDDAVIIMISAAEWSVIADEAKAAGIDKFLSKPLFSSAIADVINEVAGVREQQEEKKADYSGIFKGKKILLAEDVEINREIIQTLTEPTLLEMDCAKNGLEAVALFGNSRNKYDLILMDVQMPEMDGCEAAQNIRRLEKSMEQPTVIPIVAMTANVFKEDIEKCLESGMNSHIGKPVDVDEFFIMLKKYLL